MTNAATIYTSGSDLIQSNNSEGSSYVIDANKNSNSTVNGVMLISDGGSNWYVITIRKN